MIFHRRSLILNVLCKVLDRMEIQEYINNKKVLQANFIQFLDDDDNFEENFQNLIKEIENQKILQMQDEFKLFLNLISRVSENHFHTPNFFNKIEQILSHIKEYIKKYITNEEIFLIFKRNKRVVLFLVEQKLLMIDDSIYQLIDQIKSYNYYDHYFFIEIVKFMPKNKKNNITKNMKKFSNDIIIEKRRIGENDSPICELIRKDSLEEFIVYVNRENYPLQSEIENSYFETNTFLLKKNPTLIEYAAFFGSIQIIIYLILNNVILTPSLWLYAIHGGNADIIHLLEENEILPEDDSYLKCLEESIKCYNNFVDYFKNKILEKDSNKLDHNNLDLFENDIAYCFHYQNFSFLSDINNNNQKFMFFYSCFYNYVNLVKLFLKGKSIDVNESYNDNYNTCVNVF